MNYKKMRIIVIKYAYLISLILMFFSIFSENKLQFIGGVFLGTSISSIMFYQMTIALNKASMMQVDDAQRFARSRYAIRMIVYAVTIFASIKSNQISEIATIIGLLSIKLSVLFLTTTKKLNGH